MNPLFSKRYSSKSFDTKRPIPQDVLSTILKAAHLSPSAYGAEPWRYLVTQSNTPVFDQLLGCLVEANRMWAQNAPLLILASAYTRLPQTKKENLWAAYDTGAASLALCLQATDLGLASHQMGGFYPQKITENFLPNDLYQPLAVIALGYPQESFIPAKKRSPLNTRFFTNSFSAESD